MGSSRASQWLSCRRFFSCRCQRWKKSRGARKKGPKVAQKRGALWEAQRKRKREEKSAESSQIGTGAQLEVPLHQEEAMCGLWASQKGVISILFGRLIGVVHLGTGSGKKGSRCQGWTLPSWATLGRRWARAENHVDITEIPPLSPTIGLDSTRYLSCVRVVRSSLIKCAMCHPRSNSSTHKYVFMAGKQNKKFRSMHVTKNEFEYDTLFCNMCRARSLIGLCWSEERTPSRLSGLHSSGKFDTGSLEWHTFGPVTTMRDLGFRLVCKVVRLFFDMILDASTSAATSARSPVPASTLLFADVSRPALFCSPCVSTHAKSLDSFFQSRGSRKNVWLCWSSPTPTCWGERDSGGTSFLWWSSRCLSSNPQNGFGLSSSCSWPIWTR